VPRFWLALYRPEGFDHASVLNDAARREIDALNDAMTEAGVRVFVGGLRSPGEARTALPNADGQAPLQAGPYQYGSYVDGFWVLETSSFEEAQDWARRAAAACRGPVEVRPFHG
jgi:hypothetical protein